MSVTHPIGSGSPLRRAALAALALLVASGCAPMHLKDALRADPVAGHYDRILEAQRQRHEASAAEIAPEKTATSDELIARGDRLRERGELSQALSAYLEAVSRTPEAAKPRCRIAFLHLDQDPARAASIFLDATRRDSTAVDAWLGLALAHTRLGSPDAASSALARARALAPDSLDVTTTEALVLDQRGEHAAAQTLYRSALEQRAGDSALLNNLGRSQLASGDFASAESSFRRALDADPENRATHNNLGIALGRQQRYEDARVAFLHAGTEGAALTNLGWVHQQNGDPDGAIELYVRALDAPGVDKPAVIANLQSAEADRRAHAELLAVPTSPEKRD
jgi:Flp pilus assembly protein TadD